MQTYNFTSFFHREAESKTSTPVDGNAYNSFKSLSTNAIDIPTYETISSPKVELEPTNISDNSGSCAYEPVGSPMVYSYTKVDPLTEVRVHGVLKKNRVEESQQKDFSSDKEKGTASGNPVDATINPPNANEVEVQCGSMVENALYQRVDIIEDSVTFAGNPMYRDIHIAVDENETNK